MKKESGASDLTEGICYPKRQISTMLVNK